MSASILIKEAAAEGVSIKLESCNKLTIYVLRTLAGMASCAART